MRIISTYVLLIALTLQSFYSTVLVMDYQINLVEYLANCLNKDQLHCQGQCILMSKIREKEKDETKKNVVIYEYNALYTHKNYILFDIYPPKDEILKSQFPSYQVEYSFDYNAPIFRPPIFDALV